MSTEEPGSIESLIEYLQSVNMNQTASALKLLSSKNVIMHASGNSIVEEKKSLSL